MKQIINQFEQIILHDDITDLSVPGRDLVVRAIIQLVNGSKLIAREYVFVDTGRSKYSYHWMTADNELIHRWDNAHAVDLPTSPHHQHIGSEDNVLPSEPMTLEKVLQYISEQLATSD